MDGCWGEGLEKRRRTVRLGFALMVLIVGYEWAVVTGSTASWMDDIVAQWCLGTVVTVLFSNGYYKWDKRGRSIGSTVEFQ